MTDESFVLLPGSERGALPGAEPTGTVDASERIEVTLVTRRRAELRRDASGAPVRLSRAELEQRHGTDPADLDLVASTLARFGLEVTSRDPGSRRVTGAGPASAMTAAFGAELSLVSSPAPGGRQVTHRYREGALRIPAELDGIVVAVLGLDNRPQARSQARFADHAAAAAGTSYTPPQVAEIYQFPAGTDGTGQTLGIIELGGGFSATDLDNYFSGLGLATPSVTAQGVDGASNVADQDPNGADGEVLLDIEVAGSVAPGAAQVVYFAPNTDQGFIDAVTTAVHASPTPVAVSISWGQSEDSWTAQARSALDAAIADGVALGVTVCVAAGDNGSSDGVSGGQPHVDFPASSPHALACGGTSLQADPATGVISSETVWNDGSGGGASGGGVSDTFALPSLAGQRGRAGQRRRQYRPRRARRGGQRRSRHRLPGARGRPGDGGRRHQRRRPAVGGADLPDGPGHRRHRSGWSRRPCTPASAAAQPAPGFRDITSGSNGAYSAGPGWDACTGLGSPNGTALLGRLTGATGSG